ncbi:MAG: SPFH domain-containing protein [Crocinitomicaceae bacterium]|jgi:regulator of protease activity HflC (stomatin/prohibitin superfamily)|nr:SPFH domain-containing protein [Crocinitomicaceae bacterium]
MKKILFFAVLAAGIASCTVVRPHQVAVKSKLGKIDNKVRMAGPVAYNPFVTKVIKVNVRTMKLSTSPNTKTIITDGKGGVINMLDDK